MAKANVALTTVGEGITPGINEIGKDKKIFHYRSLI